MQGNLQTLSNGLVALVDWLSFTLFNYSVVQDIISFLGYDVSEFVDCERGAKGYKNMIKCSACNLCVLYDGNEGMGIHVDISGSAIADVINHFKNTLEIDKPFVSAYEQNFETTFLCELLKSIRSLGGKITRLDLAIDDIGCNYFTVNEVDCFYHQGRIVSKTRTFRHTTSYNGSGCDGNTIYFGRRTSDVFLRVYDKYLEQNRKEKKSDSLPFNITSWVRWEMELKNERANAAVDSIVAGMDLGEVIVGILSRYIRFINLDDSNRSRCSTVEKWQSFINGIKPLSLYVPTVEKTIDDKKKWLDYQVAPTIAAVLISEGGSYDWFVDLAQKGLSRMKKPLYNLALSSCSA